jgi:Cu(I)/Ag(I) efflux system periplasmic protein CusF
MKPLAIAVALMVSSAALAQLGARTPDEPGYTVPRTGDGQAARRPEPGQSFRGEVQAVDRTSGIITLKHDSLGALGVPARTTDYPVKDSSMLEHLKVGDRVRFSAVLQGRSLLVTNIAPAN